MINYKAEPGTRYRATQYGFEWGPFEVTRIAPHKLNKHTSVFALEVKTDKEVLLICSTGTGKVSIERKRKIRGGK